MSAGMRTVEYTRTFTEDEWSMLEVGTVAMRMEEKWDLVRHDHDHNLFFARSWSQRIVFILPLDQSGSRTCTQLFVHNDVSDEIALNVNPPVDVAYWFNLVVDHVLFQRPVPEPFVFGSRRSMILWSWIGDRATVTA